jgi:glycosyltransferase involved in cell wall biosynthesis
MQARFLPIGDCILCSKPSRPWLRSIPTSISIWSGRREIMLCRRPSISETRRCGKAWLRITRSDRCRWLRANSSPDLLTGHPTSPAWRRCRRRVGHRPQLIEHYYQGAIFVLPSICNDSFGISVVEAMGLGRARRRQPVRWRSRNRERSRDRIHRREEQCTANGAGPSQVVGR